MKERLVQLMLFWGLGLSYFGQDQKPCLIEIGKEDLKRSKSKLSEVASSIRYIKLETRPEALMGEANNYFIIVFDSGIVVNDCQNKENILLFGVDGKSWLFTYEIRREVTLIKTGVMMTDRTGKLIEKLDMTKQNQPGTYGFHPQGNRFDQSGSDILFSYWNYEHWAKFVPAGSEPWQPAYEIKVPVPSLPSKLCGMNTVDQLDEYVKKNGKLDWVRFSLNWAYVRLVTPYNIGYNYLINLKSLRNYYWGMDKKFNMPGMGSDLDGGPPVKPTYFSGDNDCVDLVNASDLLDYKDKGLYGKTTGNPISHQSFMKMLDTINPDDNPVVRIVSLKN